MSASVAASAAARPPIVLIVPTYNEEAAIGAALAGVSRTLVDRIIVADGDSRDGTARAAVAAGAEVLAAGRPGRCSGASEVRRWWPGSGSSPLGA